MPAERTKKTRVSESVPAVGDADRKRVLNVLAQRRYRQRHREKVAALEAQAKQLELEIAPQPCLNPTLEVIGNVEEVIRTDHGCLSLPDFDQDQFDMNFRQEDFHTFPCLPSPIPSALDPASQIRSPFPSTFPIPTDGAILSIPILSALRAFSSVAIALDVATYLWDPFYLHVLPPTIPALSALPANLHPVAAQHAIPHHPVLDLLPWPSVREKLICMLSMPSCFRPPVAQEDLADDEPFSSPIVASSSQTSAANGRCVKQSGAIIQLVQDMDDFRDGGGVRVHGNTTTWHEGNELVEEAWEIGDVFYSKWWWCLDQKVVEVSNRRRRERGLGRLRMMESG